MEKRLDSKGILAHEHQHKVNWSAFERAMNRHKTSKKLPYVKLIHNMWPTSHKLSEWYPPMRPICLRCKLVDETSDHPFQCKSPHAVKSFTTNIKTLQRELEKSHTSAIIVTHIVGLL